MNYNQWAQRYPEAAAELRGVIGAMPWPAVDAAAGRSEAWAQQQVRLRVAAAGGMLWRNNVGATPARCKACNEPQQPVRYGLANDSARLNEVIKSSDLVGALPRVIKPQDVGTRIAQFVAIECKQPGWRYTGKQHEAAQAAWLSLVADLGGLATFSTGQVDL